MKSTRIKYPRTLHVPWSLSVKKDAKIIKDMEVFKGKSVVVTEKMDGENTTMYSYYIHVRSTDSGHHESRDWIKAFHASIKGDIPEGRRICGENVYARHSIYYDNLKSYFLGFSVWDDKNVCLSWDDTKLIFNMLGIEPVREIHNGQYDEDNIRNIMFKELTDNVEGFVVRNFNSFGYGEFNNNVAKFVRENHVQTDKHWVSQTVVWNKII